MALFNKKADETAALQGQLAEAHAHIGQLQGWVTHLRGMETPQLEAQLRDLRGAVDALTAERAVLQGEADQARATLQEWQDQVVEVRETALLQEVGVYEYSHPLENALAFKDQLAALKVQIKAAAKSDAVTCHTDWTINGSAREGQKMARDIAKLMLRAYNTEADNAVRSVKPHTRDSVKERLSKSRQTISRLGVVVNVVISDAYHRLRLDEIDLTADYRMRVEVEKELAREERAQLREEAKAQKEYERQRAKLEKERSHYAAVLARLEAAGDTTGADDARHHLATVDSAIDGINDRAANTRAGYVYVISNVGAFGPDVVKIGMTRRLEPMDRVRELGDASVPFRFDLHALFFSEDAVSLETALHQRFADQRLNQVNTRREFFFATPRDVRDALTELRASTVLDFNETVEAIEWRASDPSRWGTTVLDAVTGDTDQHPATVGLDEDGDLSDDGQDPS